MRRTIRYSLLALFSLLIIGAAHADPIMLEHKFTKGELGKYRIAMNTKITSAQLQGDQAISNSFTASMVMLHKTLDVLPDGSGVIQVTATDIKFTGLPSTTPKQKDVTMKMTIAKNGQVSDVQMLNQATQNSGTPMNFMGLLEQVVFPGKPVDTGESWKTTVANPMGGGNMNVTSTMTSASEPIWSTTAARITQTLDGRTDLKQAMQALSGSMGAQMEQMLSGMTGTVDTTGTTELLFAPEKGKLLKASSGAKSIAKINMPAALVQSGAPATINVDVESTLTTTRFK